MHREIQAFTYQFDNLDEHPIVGWGCHEFEEYWRERKIIFRIFAGQFANHIHCSWLHTWKQQQSWLNQLNKHKPRYNMYLGRGLQVSPLILERPAAMLPDIAKILYTSSTQLSYGDMVWLNSSANGNRCTALTTVQSNFIEPMYEWRATYQSHNIVSKITR